MMARGGSMSISRGFMESCIHGSPSALSTSKPASSISGFRRLRRWKLRYGSGDAQLAATHVPHGGDARAHGSHRLDAAGVLHDFRHHPVVF